MTLNTTRPDYKKLITRYKQFGGAKLVWQYAKLGALWPAVKAGARCLLKRQSFKGIYPEVLRKTEPYLMERYAPVLRSKKEEVRCKSYKQEHPKIIWWCWLQGIDAAPPIVRACYNSLVHGEWFIVNGYIVNVIDAENWKEYIELPDFIVKKWVKKQIPPALFSDLLRLELLIKYGGAWIDSTVLCTGFKEFNGLSSSSSSTSSPSVQEFKRYLEADLFVFQYTKQGSVPVSISNWFISACQNNEVLIVLRDMLYAYWKDYNCTLDYYIFHLFFAMISKEYPEQMAAMPYAQSQRSLVLLHHWGEKFDQRKWDKLTSKVCFHKLAFRVSENVKEDKDNYFNHILIRYE